MEYIVYQLNYIFNSVNGFWLLLFVGVVFLVGVMAFLGGLIESLGRKFVRYGGRKGWWR